MSDPLAFVQPGYVAPGYVANYSSLNQVVTDLREYRRGRLPGDWTETFTVGSQTTIEGAACDLGNRNVLQLIGSPANTRTVVLWNAPTASGIGGTNDQEILACFCILTSYTSGRVIPALRVSGTLGSENMYGLGFDLTGQTINIRKYVSGSLTVLSSLSISLSQGVFYWVRFRADGNTISAKIWTDGNAEPTATSANSISLIDSSVSSGGIGLQTYSPSETVEVSYFGVGTDEQPAPNPSTLPPSLDQWIRNPDAYIELLARFEYYNPSTGVVQEYWASTLGRITGPSDYPANTVMDAVLIDAGGITETLLSDPYFGGSAVPTPSPMTLDNLPTSPTGLGVLDSWWQSSFTGRPVEIRALQRFITPATPTSDAVLMPARRSEILYSAYPTTEPQVTTETGTVTLGPPNSNTINGTLPSRTCVGISTGVECLTLSGWISIPSNAAYNVTSFCIYLRLYVPVAGVTGSGQCTISTRQSNGTAQQWEVLLGQSTNANANQIIVTCNDGLGNVIVSYTSTVLLNQGRYIDIILGVQGALQWYICIDGVEVGSGTLTANPVTPSASVVTLLNGGTVGCIICDHRIEQFSIVEDALSRFTSSVAPDQINISMHHCDDNSGSIVTDYGALANNGTLQGTLGTDTSWQPTYLGDSSVIGKPMPIAGGVLYNGATQQVDVARNAYRYNDRNKTTGSAVSIRAQGAVLTGGGGSYTDELNGAVLGVGAIANPVTFGLAANPSSPEATNIHVPQLVRDELVNRGALSAQTCDIASFDALRQLLPFKGGYAYTSPPKIIDFLNSNIGTLGGFYNLDNSGRISTGCVLPPINPGPYGQEGLLEFLGNSNRGVTFSPNGAFQLNSGSQASFGIAAWIKPSRQLWSDPSATLGAYMPTGMTIVDNLDANGGEAGYYLGIDGRTGNIIFGAPGITGAVTGLHYVSMPFAFVQGQNYFVWGLQTSTYRTVNVYTVNSAGIWLGITSLTENTNGSYTIATNAPLLIGYGPRGSWCGWIGYVIGSIGISGLGVGNALDSINWIPTTGGYSILTQRWAQSAVTSGNWAQTQYLVDLNDGDGDTAVETKNGLIGRVQGTRWCPRLTLDFRTSDGSPSLSGPRRSIPVYRVEEEYRTNTSTVTGTNVAGGVSGSDRVGLGLPYLSNPYTSQNIQTNFLDSTNLQISSPVYDAANAKAIQDMIRYRLSTSRMITDAVGWYKEMLRLGLGDEVLVYHPRFNLSTGRPMRVVALIPSLTNLNGTITVWG